MRVGIGESQLHGFDLQMLTRGAVHRMSRHINVLQNTEGDERRDALAVRRDLVQPVPVDLHADGLHPLGRKRFEIRDAHRAAVLCRMCRRRRRDLAAVKGGALRHRDPRERAGRARECEALADLGCAPAGHERFSKAWQVLQIRHGGRPLFLHD